MIWVLESDVSPNTHTELRNAIQQRGDRIVEWQDDWLSDGDLPALADSPVVFHGSLGNAATIASRGQWCPGAYCAVASFRCSAWYDNAKPWLLHRAWRIIPAEEFVEQADAVFAAIGAGGNAFVRPDSPLKPFSGRVVTRDRVSLAALDYGFYYEDKALPVVVAPVCEIGREWRFVIVRGRVIAGSAYDARTRQAVNEPSSSHSWEFAATIAAELPPPEEVYVIDICETAGELRLLELNPFSGADLYASSALKIVAAVSSMALDTWNSRDAAK